VRAPSITPGETVGRDSELAAVLPFLELVADGPAALVLEGNAGIGKTAVWSEGVRLASDRGHMVLVARPAEAEAQLPFAVLGDLLERAWGHVLGRLPDPQRQALDVAMLRAEPGANAIDPRALSLAVLNVLRGLALEAPVIVAVDDIQWIDAPSATALEFALRRLESERVGLLAARRRSGSDAAGGIPDALSPDRLRRLDIGPLDRDSLGQLLLARLHVSLSPPALNQLYRVSGGNPFFALEIARALERREASLVPGETFPLPQGLRELVRDRLDDLPASARAVTLIVAALPRPTVERVEAAAAASRIDGDGLGQALAADVVELAEGRVRFTHPLLGSVVYSETSPASRRELHARLATIAAEGEERARHLALAASEADSELAATLDDAAARALKRGAPEAAGELLEHARRLTPRDEPENRRRRSLDAADCHLKAGDSWAARSLLIELVAEMPPGLERARALLRLGGVLALEDEWQSLRDLAAEALGETDDPGTRAGCEESLAWALWFGGDLHAAVPHIRAAVTFAEEAGDSIQLAELLGEQAFLEGIFGERRTDAIIERALQIADPSAPVRMIRQPHRWWTPLLMWADELESARELSYSEYRKALETGDEHVLANVLDGLTDVERLRGDWERATRFADEMHRASLLTGQDLIRAIALSKQALVQALLGEVDEARTTAAEGMDLAERIGFPEAKLTCLHVLGFIELSLESWAEAHAHLEPAVAAARAIGIGEPARLRFVPDDAEALALLGRLEEAASTLAPFEGRATALERRWALGAAARCRALLIEAAEGPSPALPVVERAVAWHEQVLQPFELARTLLVRGQIERRAKQKAVARATLERARATFEALGAPLWSERATKELARIGGRTRRASGLTATETRVAELAAEGLTNREIAAAAHLSVNTVQAYLKRIYRELGVRSRTELARTLSPSAPAKSTDLGVSSHPPGS
jgi:DNA-binding CsgD family transcriptional regulator